MPKKNPTISQAELDRLYEQAMQKWQDQHVPKITTQNQKTIISLDAYDDINHASAQEIIKLLNLMRVKYETFTRYIATNIFAADANKSAIII